MSKKQTINVSKLIILYKLYIYLYVSKYIYLINRTVLIAYWPCLSKKYLDYFDYKCHLK